MENVFLKTCMCAAMHPDKDHEEILRVVRNTDFLEFWPIFSITGNRVRRLDEGEIFRLVAVDWDRSPWQRFTRVHDKLVKLLTATNQLSPH